MTDFLYDYQNEAVNNMHNGCILCGSVGSGKSRTGLYYYFSQNGGSITKSSYNAMKNPKDLYIITTAKKRDSFEWDRELSVFLLSRDPESNKYQNKVVVDSWNNIKKYVNVCNAFFIFDEQRVVGTGAWVKSFIKITKSNNWILLTATPGDSYSDYAPVFIANGFFRNITEFRREHVVYNTYGGYPKIDRYIATQRLDRLRRKVLVNMRYKHEIDSRKIDVYSEYPIEQYKTVMKTRWDIFKHEPIQQASSLCYVLRKICNTAPDKQLKLLDIMEYHDSAIIFYNFDYELEILKELFKDTKFEVAEYNGHSHQAIPNTLNWVYLCQYNSASEGWECTGTNVVIFFSQNYSYKCMTQAAGRIDRLNTPFTVLYYYYMKTRSGIDLAISRALREKKKFNATMYIGKF